MKIGRISLTWQRKRASSDEWALDRDPKGEEERTLFTFPDLLTSPETVRDILRNINFAADIREKRRFARFSYRVTLAWIFLLAFLIFSQGFHVLGFCLETSEFIASVGTTTVNVLGFSYLVGRHLFGGGKKEKTASEIMVEAIQKELDGGKSEG